MTSDGSYIAQYTLVFPTETKAEPEALPRERVCMSVRPTGKAKSAVPTEDQNQDSTEIPGQNRLSKGVVGKVLGFRVPSAAFLTHGPDFLQQSAVSPPAPHNGQAPVLLQSIPWRKEGEAGALRRAESSSVEPCGHRYSLTDQWIGKRVRNVLDGGLAMSQCRFNPNCNLERHHTPDLCPFLPEVKQKPIPMNER